MSQIQASHARANLMTLPAELRTRIYELVCWLQTKGLNARTALI